MRCLRGYWKYQKFAIECAVGEAMRCLRGYWKLGTMPLGYRVGEAMRCLRGYWKSASPSCVRPSVKPCVVCVATGSP